MGGDGDALVQGAMERILKMKQAISWRQEERRRNAEVRAARRAQRSTRGYAPSLISAPQRRCRGLRGVRTRRS